MRPGARGTVPLGGTLRPATGDAGGGWGANRQFNGRRRAPGQQISIVFLKIKRPPREQAVCVVAHPTACCCGVLRRGGVPAPQKKESKAGLEALLSNLSVVAGGHRYSCGPRIVAMPNRTNATDDAVHEE